MRGLRLLVASAALLLPLTAGADTIYRTVNADGSISFTSRPSGANSTVAIKSDNRASRTGLPAFAPQDKDLSRYTRYDEHIRGAASLYQIPEQLVRAVIKVESDYDPRAISSAGARGLMQLMPETAERLGVKDIGDPRENIYGGVRYLRVLANMFNGDLDFTIAAYNAGENAVISHGGIPPYAQTRDYVVKVTKFYRRYRTIPDVVDASLAPPEPAPIIVNAP
jgi:soluble lytic murein transglycosylase-like protein